MKKYTQPTVEITAFDFEDITMSTINANTDKAAFQAAHSALDNSIVVDASSIVEW